MNLLNSLVLATTTQDEADNEFISTLKSWGSKLLDIVGIDLSGWTIGLVVCGVLFVAILIAWITEA